MLHVLARTRQLFRRHGDGNEEQTDERTRDDGTGGEESVENLGTKARNYSTAGGPRLGMAPSERHDEARDRALHDALG